MASKKSVIVVTFVWRDLHSMEKMALKCGLTRLKRHPSRMLTWRPSFESGCTLYVSRGNCSHVVGLLAIYMGQIRT